jgi:hypothetical protein
MAECNRRRGASPELLKHGPVTCFLDNMWGLDRLSVSEPDAIARGNGERAIYE